MAAAYDTLAYLLDRANIHDSVTRLGLNLDLGSTEGLIKDVYAPQVIIDYTSMFGGQPIETTNEKWAADLDPMMASFDGKQHLITSLVIELPQPVQGATKPDKCRVIANVNGHLFRRTARGGPMMHNGGRYILDLVRLPELEKKGENPWRIAKHATVLTWEDGNSDVMTSVSKVGH
ncbi:uncharacterized protein GGS22DRAFT_59195 [Annulohypoxylon maeteangense]|uniref:uncharacterized protein n=1 Tax=Annulohypoxylon maeteangense TaxID=1927788 RepID=UPI002008B3F8|nr:uncharacterized protein GGS22DRAFT_59195 [Annulohypoxylon maeteangense]KAI0881520.1 hypothetical protein GGS22DRAFT_59195 [Annulohypoxylon maeteangense]